MVILKKFLKGLGIVCMLCLLLIGYFYITSLSLILTKYEIDSDFESPIRIVQITDLHNAEYGGSNSDLINKIKDQNPDLIMMTGDMLNEDDKNTDIVCNLIQKLSSIAPVYFGYGNHEKTWEKTFEVNLRDILKESGAIVVDNDYIDSDLKGNALRIGGYMGYYRTPHMITQDENQQKIEIQFFEDFENTDRYKILLNHIPTNWLDWGYINDYPVDLVLTGHYHGGVIRFFNQGLFVTYVGWFPKYTKGMFTGDKATCILSTGLGSEHIIPRLNNPGEIVVIDLK